MSVLRVGKPRRHNFFCDHHLDHGSPRPCFLIREHGERCCFARPMAGLAVLLQNRRYVLGKRRRRIVRFLCTRTAHATKPKHKQNPETFNGATCYFHFSSPSTIAMYNVAVDRKILEALSCTSQQRPVYLKRIDL